MSCVSKRNQVIRQNILTLRDSYCKAPFLYHYTNTLPSSDSDSIIAANQELKGLFSDQSILILNALGNLDEVHKIVELKKDFHYLRKDSPCVILARIVLAKP